MHSQINLSEGACLIEDHIIHSPGNVYLLRLDAKNFLPLKSELRIYDAYRHSNGEGRRHGDSNQVEESVSLISLTDLVVVEPLEG